MKLAVSVAQTLDWLVRIPVGIEGTQRQSSWGGLQGNFCLKCGKWHLLWDICQDRELSWPVSQDLEGISTRTWCAFGPSVKRQKLKSPWGDLNCIEGIPLRGCTSPKGRTDPWPGELLVKSQPFGRLQCHLPGSDSVNRPLPWQMEQVRTLSWGFWVPASGCTHLRAAQPGQAHPFL